MTYYFKDLDRIWTKKQSKLRNSCNLAVSGSAIQSFMDASGPHVIYETLVVLEVGIHLEVCGEEVAKYRIYSSML